MPDNEILNLAYNERLLIEKALKKTGGNVDQAFKLNIGKGNYMSMRTYLTKINHVYKIPH